MKNRLFGAILLIAGTATGAAMLALPVSTGRAGLIPSLLSMAFIWAYLCYAALCTLEVAISLPKDSNLVTMAEHTLGKWGKIISGISYLFLLYALNTAYIAGTTALFQDLFEDVTGILVPQIVCAIPLLIVFSLLLRRGVKAVDAINRIFMLGLVTSFGVLLAVSVPHIQLQNLTNSRWEYVLPSLSIVLTAFGYHVVIPSLASYLHDDIKKLEKAIWIGSLVPFVGYCLWQVATLGIVPLTGVVSIDSAYSQGISGAEILADIHSSNWLGGIDTCFAFFAIITSFLGVSMSLLDFLADGLKNRAIFRYKWLLFAFAFLPPLYFALSYKRAFLSALEFAGAYGVVILLAIIPALMTWRKRYSLALPGKVIAPGGKTALVIFMAISFCFILIETCFKIGVLCG
jgi:tyrosine-specific transport protein